MQAPSGVDAGAFAVVMATGILGVGAPRWNFAFPLGTYGVASRVLGSAEEIGGLRDVGTAFFWTGLAAWTLTAVGVAQRVGRSKTTSTASCS